MAAKVHKRTTEGPVHICGDRSMRFAKKGPTYCCSSRWASVTCPRCLKKKPKKKVRGSFCYDIETGSLKSMKWERRV